MPKYCQNDFADTKPCFKILSGVNLKKKTDSDLGKRLKLLRSNTSMTQADVAKIIGVARSTYENYENGDQEPNASIINNLCALYDVDQVYLLQNYDINEKRFVKIDITGLPESTVTLLIKYAAEFRKAYSSNE